MITDEEYEDRLQKIIQKNQNAKRMRELREKKEYLPKFKMPSTSKILLWVVIFICADLIMFVKKIVVQTGDSSALISLIGILPTIISVALGYYSKSTKENTSGGIVYETALQNNIFDGSDESVG